MAKVKPLDPVPSAPVKSVDLFAGRNEFEPFQIVLRANTRDLSGVDIAFSNFRSAEGAEISRNNVTVYLEAFVNLTRPSSIEGGEGLWPDPLIPRVDRYLGEARNAFPFTLLRGRNQPLWVEIFVPVAARPGRYSGSAHISLGRTVQFSVPINLTVWRFALPSTSTLRSSFGLSGINVLKQHRGRYTNDTELHALTELYTRAALLHRISTHGGSMQPPAFSHRDGRMQLDWRKYDAEVGPFLDGVAIPEGEPLHGARATSVEIRSPKVFETEEQEKSYWTEWTRHFQAKGWGDRLFLYLWDEPAGRDFPAVLRRGRVSVRATPRLRNLVTVPFTRKLEEVVQIWVPLVNCLEVKPGYADFCDETPPFAVYARQTQPGKGLWFYQSCASHGCNIVGGPYFTGWPSYMIDAPGAANRVMQWLAWKFRMEGELYYSMNEAYGQGNDPWVNVYLFGGNGDGTLFYPGRPARIGGRRDIPIESIRLKLIREGMEDYEYLALLARLKGRKLADQCANRIVKEPYLWESRPEVFLEVRRELGASLDRAAAGSSETI
ncbi:MAG: DUF4091 domain-containing protein [Acidobacteria bacterium]|nr:DUF4091 domain-containing protein [Acidobacteriota bacterium]